MVKSHIGTYEIDGHQPLVRLDSDHVKYLNVSEKKSFSSQHEVQ